jgi:hypothetical protein
MAISQSFLLGRGGKKTQSFLINAHGAAGNGRVGSRSVMLHGQGTTIGVSAVDAGQAQTLEPFQTCTLNGVVVVPNGGTATSMTWIQTAGTPQVVLNPSGSSASFKTPAKAAGTTLTFQLTGTFDGGLPNASDTVQVTVRPHAEWMAVGPDTFAAVLDSYDALPGVAETTVTPTGFGASPFGASPFGA